MKLTVCGSALIIALLAMPPVMAEDSVYLEERMKRLHEKQTASIQAPATSAAPTKPLLTDPWWR
ncbi:hypothetical protein [Halomonas cerina]|uniref:Uncharacterized protein n=1 Tax=Halomonas cerina TaxID=447424 RepID=A0A839VFH9_9GAMM|nr:hypothetical protein [Halomonas cerina]MBB3191394.1 hypothetical protein [Halomonas cerina]